MTSAGYLHMSAATCAVLANVIPIFFIALIAERTVSRRDALLGRAVRFLADLILATLMLMLEIGVLIGVEKDGLNQSAPLAWVGSGLVMLAVLYRWALLSPTMNDVVDAVWRGLWRLLTRLLPGLRRFEKTDQSRRSRASRTRNAPERKQSSRATRLVHRASRQ